VYAIVCCFARTNALPDDVLLKIVWLVDREAFSFIPSYFRLVSADGTLQQELAAAREEAAKCRQEILDCLE
jgi:hypothetical protein